jgi:C1A family cysteine protease
MIDVKNQGGCGSCWAFAANSALEGTVSAKTGRNPVRMSEQHLVDCTLRNNSHNMDLFGEDFGLWGCGGGWMATAWYFQSKHGVMLDSDYPYTSGRTGTESKCAHDGSKTIGKVSSWNRIDASGSLDEVKQKLKEQPLTIAVDAGSSHFQFYSKGVVGANDGCPTGLNHAVVLVGYTEKDGSPSPDPSPEPEPQPDPDNDAECNVYKWWHSCDEDNSRRMLKDENGYDNYWKIQNSWSTNWGDQGFILFEIAEGDGVCGMNSYIEYADM